MPRRRVHPPKLTLDVHAGERTSAWDDLWAEMLRDIARKHEKGAGPATDTAPKEGTGDVDADQT